MVESISSRAVASKAAKSAVFSRTLLIGAIALCVFLCVGYYFYTKPSVPLNRTFPDVPGTAPKTSKIQVVIDKNRIQNVPVPLSKTILRIVKDKNDASYPISSLKLEIFKYTKDQDTHVCIRRSEALRIDNEVQSIKFSYLGRNGQLYEGRLFSHDPSQKPNQLQFGLDRINNLTIIVTKKDGAVTYNTFTTK